MLYIIELFFLVIDLLLIYKIANYISKKHMVAYISTILSIIPLLLSIQGGNFVEEYALPFILLALYIFIKDEKSTKGYILSGVSLGAVLMLRPNMVVVWIIGYMFITIELLYRKDFKEFFRAAIFSIIGLIGAITPFIIYLLINNAFGEFINQYIVFNIKYASANNTNVIQFLKNYKFVEEYIVGIIIITNIIILIKELITKNKEEIRRNIFSLLFIILTAYIVVMPCNPYKHYAIILIPCYIITITNLIKLLKYKEVFYIIILYIIIVMPDLVIANQIADFKYNNKMYDMCNYIKTISDEDDDVIMIGNFCLIYLLSDRTTDCKYIYQFPPINMDEKIRQEVKDYIYNNMPDVIVYTRDTSDNYFYNLLTDLTEHKYYVVDKSQEYTILLKKEGELN